MSMEAKELETVNGATSVDLINVTHNSSPKELIPMNEDVGPEVRAINYVGLGVPLFMIGSGLVIKNYELTGAGVLTLICIAPSFISKRVQS